MELHRHIPKKAIPVVLLRNKTDLRDIVSSSINPRDGRVLAMGLTEFYAQNKWDIPYFETSAKTGFNYTEAFLQLGRMIRNANLAR
jgi:GTPase SAR1 family protein